jgi:methyltransferase (TIGR00027 family)
MKPGQESQTAVMVCMARAAADGSPAFNGFSDPTALALLPEAAAERVRRLRANAAPTLRERVSQGFILARARMMVPRTVAIDAAVHEHPAPQLVVLGAGLDGRAWRMPELRDTLVFEVDHPDSQRAKRARAAHLTQTARDVRFVPVDFARDHLDTALAAAGHDPTLPTTWIWEGVVMYLTRAEIEATLAVVAQLSHIGSRLIVAYFVPAWMLRLVGPLVRRLGEPLRSVFSVEEMRALLARYGFTVVSDRGLLDIATGLSPELARATRPLKHLRVVVADRSPN